MDNYNDVSIEFITSRLDVRHEQIDFIIVRVESTRNVDKDNFPRFFHMSVHSLHERGTHRDDEFGIGVILVYDAKFIRINIDTGYEFVQRDVDVLISVTHTEPFLKNVMTVPVIRTYRAGGKFIIKTFILLQRVFEFYADVVLRRTGSVTALV